MSSWSDFNDAQTQNFDVIPKGTIERVRLTIRPGGYNDEQQAGPAATPPATPIPARGT